MVVVAVQLGWRVLFSENNVVQAFPEFIATAIARLTPLSVFGTVTETYGSLAKRSLLVACVIGIVALGPVAGQRALALTRSSQPSFVRRLGAGLVVATVLLAIALIVILPIANLGVFARESSYQSDILTQLLITFGLWTVLWAMLSHDPSPEPAAAEGQTVSRRAALTSAGWGVLALGSIGAVVASLTDMFRTPKLSEEERLAQEESVDQIVSSLRSDQMASPEASANEQATATGPVLFEQLETDGRLTPVLTANADFYHVSKNFTDPTVSADGWTLTIGGLVTTPMTFTYEELLARADVKQVSTLCCISNELNGSLIGTAEWTGIRLMDLLNQAGVKPEAVDLKFSAADDYTDSVPVSVGQDPHVLLVVGMNGDPLPDDHGYPARLIIPPIYGMKNLKWLQKIEAVDSDYQGYWQERGWSDTARYQIWGRIDSPGSKVDPGPAVACGVASAGDRGVSRVEVSLDGGTTWADAELEPAINAPLTWVRWAYPFEAVAGKHEIRIRVTDGTGEVMLQEQNPPLPDGATGWPKRTITVG